MGVKITGQKALLGVIEKRLGQAAVQHITDRALLAGAQVFVSELKRQFEMFKDTGASIEEITITGPKYEKNTRVIRIHWTGPKGRYRVIHLNEWGTINNPNPPGKGAVARAMRNAEKEYINTVKRVLKEAF